MKSIVYKLALILMAVAVLGLAGCENEGATDDEDIAGTWSGTIEDDATEESTSGTLVLTQDGTEISGTASTTWGSSSVSGEVDGDSVSLTIASDTSIDIDATVDGDTMSGTWENDDGDSGTVEFELE